MTEAPLAPVGAIAANRSDPLVFSFLEDWKALGVLAISLFDISLSDLERDQSSGPSSHKNLVELKPSEIDLLRSLLNPERNQALDSEIVSSRIDGVSRELKLQSSTDNGRYVLALRLGDASRLSSAIRVATSEAIETDDRAAQIAFVVADIETGAQLCRGTRGHYLLTETLAYELQPLRQAGTEETWNIASCNMAKSRADLQLGRVVETER